MEHLLTIDQQRKNCCPIDFDVIGLRPTPIDYNRFLDICIEFKLIYCYVLYFNMD